MRNTTRMLVLLAVAGVVVAGGSSFAAGDETSTESNAPGPFDGCIVFCEELKALTDATAVAVPARHLPTTN